MSRGMQICFDFLYFRRDEEHETFTFGDPVQVEVGIHPD